MDEGEDRDDDLDDPDKEEEQRGTIENPPDPPVDPNPIIIHQDEKTDLAKEAIFCVCVCL